MLHFRSFSRGSPVVLIAAFVLCAGVFVAGQSKGAAQFVPSTGTAGQLPPTYQRWLNEDVVYIITPEERSAFVKLKTTDERDYFITQFWQRRDPTPGTEENEYKEEHYRRIAFANVHFAESRPGWETDRGRIYVVDGPPDEITQFTTHAADGSERQGYVWHYTSLPSYPWELGYDEGKRGRFPKHDPADFTFVDHYNSGNYQLVTPTAR